MHIILNEGRPSGKNPFPCSGFYTLYTIYNHPPFYQPASKQVREKHSRYFLRIKTIYQRVTRTGLKACFMPIHCSFFAFLCKNERFL